MRVFGVSILTIALVYGAYWAGRRSLGAGVIPA